MAGRNRGRGTSKVGDLEQTDVFRYHTEELDEEGSSMKTKSNQGHPLGPEVPEPHVVTIEVPDDFDEMNLNSRIVYVADGLKSSESRYPDCKDSLRRHTSLVKIGKGGFSYLIEYLPIVDSDY